MKIKRFVEFKIEPAVADRYIDPNSGNTHYNLNHGTRGEGLWRWFAGLDSKHFTDTTQETITLEGDDYNFLPIYVKGSILKDKKGNICYNITKDSDLSHRRDIVLLWNIPVTGYNDIRYTYKGNVTLLGEAIAGKPRGVSTKGVPAPIMEITGECELAWSGINGDGKRVEQVIKYHYGDSWDISAVNVLED